MTRVERLVSKKVERQLWNYPDEWVVFTYKRILAHAPTVTDELLKAAAKKGAVLHYVPLPGVAYFYATAGQR